MRHAPAPLAAHLGRQAAGNCVTCKHADRQLPLLHRGSDALFAFLPFGVVLQGVDGQVGGHAGESRLAHGGLKCRQFESGTIIFGAKSDETAQPMNPKATTSPP
jgi:hypothetical protein